MNAASLSFQDSPSRCSLSEQSIVPGGVPRAIRSASEGAGLDPIAELYNEALRFATEGHLKPARERLLMLLAMCPEDGEAGMLLTKVLIGGQRWQEALATIDATEQAGHDVPEGVRLMVEEHLRADTAADEEERQARLAREQGEIKALRQEARRLRSENAQLLGRSHDLERSTRNWAWSTAGVASMATLFLFANLLFGGSKSVETPMASAVTDAPQVAAAQVDAAAAPSAAAAPAAPQGSSTAAIAERAASALAKAPQLEDTTLEVEVLNHAAKLSGVVPTFRHRKDAEAILLAVKGVDSVDADGIEVLARTRGTRHTVRSGDSLSRVAYEYYGDSSLSKTIQGANKATLKGGSGLSVGQVLALPAIR